MVADGSEGTLDLVFNVFDDGWSMGDGFLFSPIGCASWVMVVLRSGLSFFNLVPIEMPYGLVVVGAGSGLWTLGRDGDVAVVDGGWIDIGINDGSFDTSATARVSFYWAWALVSNFGLSLVYWAWAMLFYFFFCYLSILMDDEVSTSLFV